jgi:Vault protein inter-alpha-trypsin domain
MEGAMHCRPLMLLMGLCVTCQATISCRGSTKDPLSYLPPRAHAAVSFAAMTSSSVRRAALSYPAPRRKPIQQRPLSLTATDGTGLTLVSFRAKAVIQGPLALTELHLAFHNPQPRVREGRFAITLPPRAAISRFAMRMQDGRWQEAEVVERQAARQIYEDFLHRGQDPALLERKAGNQFRARVFPILGDSVKELIVTYSEQLADPAAVYRLRLRGLPRIETLQITALVAGRTTRINKRAHAPRRDFEVRIPAGVNGLRSGDLALVRVVPDLDASPAPLGSLLVLVDTSASRAAGFRRQVAQLAGLLRQLKINQGPATPLQIACFDQQVSSVYHGRLGDLSSRHLDAILARRPLGASNLHRALTWALRARHRRRVLLVTDGISTAGPSSLRTAVRGLGPRTARLDVLVQGGIRDEEAMRALVRGQLEQDGVVLDGDAQTVEASARRLGLPSFSGLRVTAAGAIRLWPHTLNGLQPGDARLVFARLRPAAAHGPAPGEPLILKLGQQEHRVALAAVARPLLERAWAEARIAALQRVERPGPEIQRQIIALSTRHRVLSDHTAMLVLETEADYARYRVKRRALTQILTTGQRGARAVPASPAIRVPRRTRRTHKTRRTVRVSRIDFSDDLVQGELLAPDGEMIATRRRSMHSSLITLPHPPALRQLLTDQHPALRVPVTWRSFGRYPITGATRKQTSAPPLTGRLARVTAQIHAGHLERALTNALRWRAEQPGDVMALIALGDALQAHGALALAARVYGSIIDLYPSRADMRRFAGERLEALGPSGLALAVDSYRTAARQRPDHGVGHHLLGLALARQGRLDDALSALEQGLQRLRRPRIRRPGVQRVLREDLGLVAAALLARSPYRHKELSARLARHSAVIARRPGLRFLLTWQTDANDVDLHVRDGVGGHAHHAQQALASGGALYDDVRNGYGPECLAVEGTPRGFPYRLQVHYFARGPMGYGMGRVQILRHDGRGTLRFADRPFVVMNDRAFVELGQVSE